MRKCNLIDFIEHCGCTVYSMLFVLNMSYVEPPLSGQLLKSRNYCQYSTANKIPLKATPIKWWQPPFCCPNELSSIVFILI